jgi:dTDP-4-amino-4,6-dideoxygalactose transaminase
MINVTKPFLPPREEVKKYIDGIWDRAWLTNNGPLVNELELKLKKHLGLRHLLFLNNGTIAIQIALKALDVRDEVVTTPFSYVATTSSIVWENCKPVFADIHPETLNIDPAKVEKAITKKTTAILATHVYGNPCDIDALAAIAKKHKLKIIYDGAHAFGVKFKKRSVFECGDVTTASFHATKLYHTVEGGAVVTRSADLLKRMAFMRNFGHNGPAQFEMVGINGKNSEMHAAIGLCNLNYINEIMLSRREQSAHYDEMLFNSPVRSQLIKPLVDRKNVDYNYSYYPLVFESEKVLERVISKLNGAKIFPRRYFYPSLSKLKYLARGKATPVSDDISSRVLALPLYHTLTNAEIDLITRVVIRTVKYA